MTLLATTNSFFYSIDATTIILGVLAILAALISLYSSVLESKDKRKHFLGLNVKSIKLIAAYCSFVLTLLTLIMQDKHESDNKIAEDAKEHAANLAQHGRDSIQRNNLDTTLKYINLTLSGQKTTLDSTKNILNRQRSQLSLELATLDKQKQSLDSNTKIIKSQNLIAKGVKNSVSLTQKTLDSVLEVYAAEKANSNNLLQLTTAVNFGVMGTIRFYTINEDKLWKPGTNPDGLIYHKMTNINPFLDNYIKPVGNSEQHYLRLFFNNMSPNGFDHQFFLSYQLPSKNGDIVFEKPPTIDPRNFDGLQIPFDITYNARQHYFEWEAGFNSYGILSNSGGIENLNILINHSTAYIVFKYKGDKDFDVEGYSGKQHVTIGRIDMNLTTIGYGNMGQNQIALTPANSKKITDKNEIKRLAKEDIPDSELWRYLVFQIEMRK